MTEVLLLAGSDGPDGIHLLAFEETTGTLSMVRRLPGADDASFLAVDPGARRLYAADHERGRLGVYAIEPAASGLRPLGARSAGATSTCYVALSPDRKHIATASYDADVTALFAIATDGTLMPGPQLLRGTGAVKPGHAHWVQWSPEGERIYVVDLGHDEVRMHAYDRASGRAGPPATAFRTPTGHGPRHLAFHPKGETAYLLTELGNTLIALRRRPDGTFEEIQTVPSLPAHFEGKAKAAHLQISPDGSFVYVSNRGPQTIGVFRTAPDGRVREVQQAGTGGDWPRFFLLLGRHLLVCHQRSGTIVVFDVAHDGRLTPNGQSIPLHAPVMLLPVSA